MSLHFFISRAGEDREWGKWIANVLEAAGHTTTVQDKDFKSGSFPEHIQGALANADRFIAVLSPHYMAKPFTVAELHAAYARDPLNFIIPVRVEPCKDADLIKHLVYVDFVGKDDEQRKYALLDVIGPAPSRTASKAELRTSIQKLPHADPNVFGRDAQFGWLEQAWQNPQTNFVQIIAPGGAGKTALMSRWYRQHVAEVTIFGWSFYTQGTDDKSQTSSDLFLAEALGWFKIDAPATASTYSKVDLLAARLRQEPVLMILDGVEPLQEPSGSLRDLALKSLLQELAARNAGMVLVTTRVRLTDIPDDAPRSVSLDLENLDPADGARYLAYLGVRGEEDELRRASEEYWNHALAITLLGTYLADFCGGDIRRRVEIPELMVEDAEHGAHARRVIAAYEKMFAGKPELEILRAVGYFNRPAESAALHLVLPKIKYPQYPAALKHLFGARLILSKDPAQPIDCHPLIREYFAAEATEDGHARLYEYYAMPAPRRYPLTLDEMTPLFHAVYHGCRAKRHQEALDKVYRDRIQRETEAYLSKNLGAHGASLSLLANFFETPWSQIVPSLSADSQPWLMNTTGFVLRAIGRLIDSVECTRAGAEAYVRSKNWLEAPICHVNLSELHLALGNLSESIAVARLAVDFAVHNGRWFNDMRSRTALAAALHQSGHSAEAMSLFAEAESIGLPHYPILHSIQGYQYCDLLLDQGQTAEVRKRATTAQNWEEGRLVDIGLNHLLLGRSHPGGSSEAAYHLEQAVEFLRRGGLLDQLPLALLARGTPQDLDEVLRIATRSGMRLYLADYHLARGNLAEAEALIRETGYHRRDAALEKLRRR